MLRVEYTKQVVVKKSDGMFLRKHHLPLVLNVVLFVLGIVFFVTGYFNNRTLFLVGTVLFSLSLVIYCFLGGAYLFISKKTYDKYNDKENVVTEYYDVRGNVITIESSLDNKKSFIPMDDLKSVKVLANSIILNFKDHDDIILPRTSDSECFVNQRIKPIRKL